MYGKRATDASWRNQLKPGGIIERTLVFRLYYLFVQTMLRNSKWRVNATETC